MTQIYSLFVALLVVCIFFGNFGGAFQVDRLLAILFLPWLFANIGKKGCEYTRDLTKVLACFYIYMLISFIWTPDKQEAIKEVVYYLVHFILFLELVLFARFANMPLKWVSRGWMIAVLICSVIAYWEITTGQHLSLAKDQGSSFNTGSMIVEHMTASVTFNNYNSYVTLLCFSYPWIFYVMLDKERKLLEKLIALVALIMASLVIIINASRGGVLSMIIMLLIYYWYSEKSWMKNMVLILFIMFLGYVLIQYGESITAVIAARASGGAMFEDEARSIIWTNALETFADTFGFGVGIGGLSEAMKEYAHGGITVTHNMILEILVQYGVIITFVVVWFLWRQFRKSLKVERSRKIVLMMALITMPVYAIIDSGYLLTTHLYVLMATIYIFANYELIKRPNGTLRKTA